MQKVSVIIPVYNALKFIEKTLIALQKQTYANAEFVFVDDGSTDGTTDVLLKAAAKMKDDTRFKFIFKENNGVSAARNDAIKQATGEYITFVDADDIPSQDMLTTYVNKIEKNHVDMVFFSAEKVDVDGNSLGIISYPIDQCNRMYSQKKLVEFLGQQLLQGYLFLSISKRDLWDANSFDVNLKVQEDLAAIAKAVSKKEIITGMFFPEIKYQYVQHENSAMHKLSVEDIVTFVTVADKIESYFDDANLEDKTKSILNGLVISSLMNVLAVALLTNNSGLFNKFRPRYLTEFKKTKFPDSKVKMRKLIQYIAIKFKIKFVITVAYKKIFQV